MTTKHSSHFFLVCFLALLAMLGFFASDMYLPAFPSLANELHTQVGWVQMTLSVYLAGLALGQIVYGIFSDRFGRKSVLFVGMILFALGSFGCHFSHSIYQLLAWRIVQALGVCAAAVLWQAIIIDRFDSSRSHQLFAIIFPLLGLSPALAPSVGGWLTIAWGWRSIFLVLGLLALVMAVFTLLTRESTSSESRAAHPIQLKLIVQRYGKLLRSWHFIGYVGLVCFATASFFAYLAGSPFALKAVGFNAHQIGLSYIPQTLLFMLGGFLSKKLSDRIGAHWLIISALLMAVLCGALLSYFVIGGYANAKQIILPFLLIAVANGMLYPPCMNIALNRFPDMAGTAAGLSGFLQSGVSFLATSVVASLSHLGEWNMPVIILVLSVCNVVLYLFVRLSTKE